MALTIGVAVVRKHRTPHAAAVIDAQTGPRTLTAFNAVETAYDGKLGAGWDDWGWGPHKLGGGPAQIDFGGFGGITLHHSQLASRYGALVFRFKAPEKFGEFLSVSIKLAGTSDAAKIDVEKRHMAPLPDGWQEVLIDWSVVNPTGQPFDRIEIAARVPLASEWVQLDKVVLTEAKAGSGPAVRADILGVSCRAQPRPIDPLIYGGASDDYAAGQVAQRFGGNTLTRNNWETGTWNTGNDWFFRNVSTKGTLFDWVADAAKQGQAIAVAVPMIGWVSKDNTSFSFPKSKFPTQRKYDPEVRDAGDGFDPKGKPLKPLSPTQTSIEAPPELVARWVGKLAEQDKARAKRAVRMYILDNEPTLWDQTHRDVHPEPLSYDELIDRTVRYASAIRDADPGVAIAGPAEWGWTGYLYSAVDRVAGTTLRPDRRKHGDVPLIPWYLGQLAQQDKKLGKRLLDYLDVHFYPMADGMYGGGAKTDPASSELRVRSTRALWDPTYNDESWVKEPIRLIPRLKEWVSANYPGTKLSLGEWSFGADDHISGGLAAAETLGRFGQQGLDAAFFWGGPRPGTATFWAFRAFRNFDGKGGRFQDLGLKTRESDLVSLFASRDASAKHLVLVLVNRDPKRPSDAQIELDGCGRVAASHMFSYQAGSKELAADDGTKASDTHLTARLAPFSFAVIDLEIE